MRLDRGTRIFTRCTTKPGQPVWVPDGIAWWPGTVSDREPFESGGGWWVGVRFELGNFIAFPLWQLRERKPSLDGRDKPNEPVPPTHGKPKGIKLVGILTNGSVRGRC